VRLGSGDVQGGGQFLMKQGVKILTSQAGEWAGTGQDEGEGAVGIMKNQSASGATTGPLPIRIGLSGAGCGRGIAAGGLAAVIPLKKTQNGLGGLGDLLKEEFIGGHLPGSIPWAVGGKHEQSGKKGHGQERVLWRATRRRCRNFPRTALAAEAIAAFLYLQPAWEGQSAARTQRIASGAPAPFALAGCLRQAISGPPGPPVPKPAGAGEMRAGSVLFAIFGDAPNVTG